MASRDFIRQCLKSQVQYFTREEGADAAGRPSGARSLARAKLDMMNATAGKDDEGHSAICHERTVRILDRNLRSRTSSGPAEISPRQKAGHMTASRQIVQTVEKAACQSGPSTYDRWTSENGLKLGPSNP
ncbi:MAG: hypothetical protein ACREV8_00530, partial [Gammaproteobacteria bacterium]